MKSELVNETTSRTAKTAKNDHDNSYDELTKAAKDNLPQEFG